MIELFEKYYKEYEGPKTLFCLIISFLSLIVFTLIIFFDLFFGKRGLIGHSIIVIFYNALLFYVSLRHFVSLLDKEQ